ncbi:MAG TPA: hypothetical protein VI298_00960 [Geobacteraceae bacterium]
MNVRKMVLLVTFVLGGAAGNGNAAVGVPGHRDITFATHAADCGVCHQQQYNEWRFAAGSDSPNAGFGSAHAITNTDPNYVSILPRVNPVIQTYCRGCHEGKDAWGVQDRLANIPAISDINKSEGTSCITCHFDGEKIVGKGQSIVSPFAPEFCGTCHNESTGMTNLYEEWKTDYIGGGGDKTCLDCHMAGGNHVMLGFNSPSFVKKAIVISQPALPDTVSANTPFDISYTLTNSGAGHSVPEDLFRLMRARLSIVDSNGQEVFSQETVYYKKKALLRENPADTVIIKAHETKNVTVPGVVIAAPGTYTVKLELLQNSNRVFVDRNTIAFMGATYSTIVVQ